jgi:bacteriocin biosynthesis cyclodehydratase domain-containing protein
MRAGLAAVARDGETIIISPRLESMDAIDDRDGVWAALLHACDGTVGLDGVEARLAASSIGLSRSDIAEGIAALTDQGLLVDASDDVLDEWSNQRSYIEQLTRDATDVELAHDRVRSTRALVIGAGGTGSWLALSLTMMGVGDLMVVDPDVVEERNRTRQPYAADMVGRRKVEALGEMVTRLRPGLRYAGVDLRVEHESDLGSLVQGMDVVACCADEPSLDAIASLIARACLAARVPHIICGYHGASGRVGPFWYPRRRPLPCPGCHIQASTEMFPFDPAAPVASRRRTPVIAAQPQMVAAVAASEILHFRAGVPPATAGRLFALDSLTLDSRRTRVALRDDCPICFGGRKQHVASPSPVSA